VCAYLCTGSDTELIHARINSYVLIRLPFVYAVCQCAGLDSRGFNTRYRGDCCSLSVCSTQPDDRISSHQAQSRFVKWRVRQNSPLAIIHGIGRERSRDVPGMFKKSAEYRRFATGSIAELLILQQTKWLEYRDTMGIMNTE